MLASRTWGIKGPTLLFIHGFLGCKEDWTDLITELSPYCICHAIDLPGHGQSAFQSPIIESIGRSIQQLIPTPCIVIGYSMGGRIALMLKEKMPYLFDRQIIFSSHPGLSSSNEKKKKWEEDLRWIQLLRTTSFSEFIEKWYEQEIFASSRHHPQLMHRIKERRQHQTPAFLAQVLEELSLAKMVAPSILPHTFFFHGEQDLKYAALYSTILSLHPVIPIADAGHMIHLENPKMCAHQIKTLLNLC